MNSELTANCSSDNSMDTTGSKTQIYNIKFFFRGRRIAEDCEPPTDLIDDFLDFVANGVLHFGWDQADNSRIEHAYCDENCAIETCLAFGWPYTASLRESLKA